MAAEFVAQGRFTRFPGKEAIINRLLNGEHPILAIGRDNDGRVILINPDTNETAGCIAPNPSYGENYDILEAFIDMNIPMEIVATKTCKFNKHYHLTVTVQRYDNKNALPV
jgi:hypothetical protein